MTLKDIEQAVEDLSETERAEFRRWFAAFDGDCWDEQIEEDALAGKLDELAKEALAEYRSGTAREL